MKTTKGKNYREFDINIIYKFTDEKDNGMKAIDY